MTNAKCPPRKREPMQFVPNEHGHLHTVVLFDDPIEERAGFFRPDHKFDWLHKNVARHWHGLYNNPFSYLGRDNERRKMSSFQFENDEDAVLFRMKFGGRILPPEYSQTFLEEKRLSSALYYLRELSRDDRRYFFDGLDALVAEASLQHAEALGRHFS